jgi:hypothetical protein
MNTFENPMISNYWRLCDHLTVRQAALLTIGYDPSSEDGVNCEHWAEHQRPEGYEAAKQGIGSALRRGVLEGDHVSMPEHDYNGNETGEIPGTTHIDRSTVSRDSLVDWLSSRGISEGFFFPPQPIRSTPGYLDRKHHRYAPKLAAAVRAWEAVTDPGGMHPKQALAKWLREHAAEFGLSDEEGKPNEQGIEETSKVANWQQQGGAAKTPG